ncbi:MAG: TonB-dependent receptor [Sphingobacteriales bacterium]|nr:TonB-dependent receptor [Sphingobacteriales bacterium]
MLIRKLLLIISIFLLSGAAVFAQSAKITGKVSTSENGTPLPGVTVKNGKASTVTDKDGAFSLSASKGSVLTFSHTGYEEMQVTVGDNHDLAVSLVVKVGTLDQVVVVGYGTAKRRDLTGSIAKVEYSSRVNTTVTPSFEAGLQGRATGLQIISSNAVPGSAIRVRVRGQNSFTGSGDPLYVVDGVPVYSGDYSITDGAINTVRASNANVLSTIDPADIESVEVLKDAAASAIYGARGANGVIVITTKRGKAGKTSFNASYSIGQSQATNKLELISSQDWWMLYNEARVNDGNAPRDPAVPLTINGGTFIYNDVANVNTNWVDESLRKGITQDVNVSARGGNEKTQFFVGGGYKTQEGILKGNNYDRISGRVNIDNQATQNFKFGLQSSISYTKNEQVPTSFGGGLGAAQSTALRLFPVYNADKSFYGTQFQNTGMNPVARLLNTYTTKSTRFINNIYADFRITPSLSFRAEYGLDILDQFEERYDHKINRYFSSAGLAARWERRMNITNMNGNAYFTYKNTFHQRHNITITAGSSIQNSKTKAIGFNPAAGGVGFINDYFNETTSTMVWAPGSTPAGSSVTGYNQRDAYRFLSFFARANYKLSDKYLVGASFRADGSSRFGSDHQFGYFPALSAGWILTEESFMQNNKLFSFLKFRASYGYTGNSEIGNFRYLGTFSSTGGYTNFPGITPTRLPNPDISWEKARQLDLGFDFGLLNGRFNGSLGFYRKISTDVLLDKPAPTSATGLGSILVNAEDVVVRNLGAEFELTARIIRKNDFTWTADFNISTNQNKVLETGNVPPDGFGAAEGDTRVVKGYPIGISYLAKSAGVNPLTGNEMIYALDGTVFDALKQSDITSNRQPLGKPFPDFIAGLNNTLTWKNFELSFLFYASQGNKIYDDGAKRQMGGFIGTWNQRTEVLKRWQKPGDETNIPKLTITGSSFAGSDRNTSRFLFDASFVRLRSLNFAYNLPVSVIRKAGLSAAKLFINGSNLLTFTKYKGWDPEVVRYNFSAAQSNISFDAPYLPTPQAKTIVVGINLSF